jgi:transposase-like protein
VLKIVLLDKLHGLNAFFLKEVPMQRKQYSAEFKAKMVVKVLSGEATTAEIAKRFQVHPLMLTKWKKQALDRCPALFSRKPEREREQMAEREAQLFQQIGQLQYELDWLKKKMPVYDR